MEIKCYIDHRNSKWYNSNKKKLQKHQSHFAVVNIGIKSIPTH